MSNEGIRRAIERAGAEDGCPVRALGQLDGTYFFVTQSGELRAVAHRDLSTNGILSLFEGQTEWLKKTFPKKDSNGNDIDDWAPRAAAAGLMRCCAEAGLFDDRLQVRRHGVWRGPVPDEGGAPMLVVHAGDAVMLAGSDGAPRWHRPGLLMDGALYAACASVPRPAVDEATAADGKRLLAALGLWNFADPAAGHVLVLGFIGSALLGGAPTWRAHLLTTAAFGSGKTWLTRLIAAAMGPQAFAVNNFTEAGLRQMLTGEARTMILDESEPDSRGGRVQQVIELLRHMSSGDGARGVRGSPEGAARSFDVTGCAYLSSILGVSLQPQDRSRITQLELLPLGAGSGASSREERARNAITWAGSISGALRLRAVKGWPCFLANLAVFRGVLLEQGCDSRQADQFGTLLAGAEMLTSDAVVEREAAAGVVAHLARIIQDRQQEDEEDGDGPQCLTLLLSSPVDHWRSGSRETIGMVLSDQLDVGDKDTDRVLRSYGLAVDWSDRRAPALLVANRHQGLERIFAGTKWAQGVWAQSLKRLSGASAHGPESFGGAKSRCARVPHWHLPGFGERRSPVEGIDE